MDTLRILPLRELQSVRGGGDRRDLPATRADLAGACERRVVREQLIPGPTSRAEPPGPSVVEYRIAGPMPNADPIAGIRSMSVRACRTIVFFLWMVGATAGAQAPVDSPSAIRARIRTAVAVAPELWPAEAERVLALGSASVDALREALAAEPAGPTRDRLAFLLSYAAWDSTPTIEAHLLDLFDREAVRRECTAANSEREFIAEVAACGVAAVPVLLARIRQTRDETLHHTAFQSLLDIQDPRVVAAIFDLLREAGHDDELHMIRIGSYPRTAAQFVARYPEVARPHVDAAFRSDRPDQRVFACYVLREGAPAVDAALRIIGAFEDVRRWEDAKRSENFLFMCGTNSRSRTERTLNDCAEFLIRCPFPPVIAELARRCAEWRLGFPVAARCAVRILGEFRTESALSALLPLVQSDNKDNDSLLTECAWQAIARIGGARARSALDHAYAAPGGDENPRLIEALAQVYRDDPLPLLRRLEAKPHWHKPGLLARWGEAAASHRGALAEGVARWLARWAATAGDPAARACALTGLAHVDRRLARAAVQAAVNDPAPAVRQAAIPILSPSDRNDTLLLRLSADPDPTVRADAIWRVLRRCAPAFRPAHLSEWLESPLDEVRAIGIAAAGRARAVEFVPAIARSLVDWLRAPKPTQYSLLIETAAAALEQLTALPLRPEPAIAGTTLPPYGPEILPAVLALLSWHPSHREQTREEWIFEAARHPRPGARILAAKLLAGLRSTVAGDALVDLLADDDFWVCHAAGDGFRDMTGHNFGWIGASPRRGEPDPIPRLRAWWQQHRSESWWDWQLDALNSSDDACWAARNNIAQCTDASHLPAVLAILNTAPAAGVHRMDQSPFLAAAARLGDRDAPERLLQAMRLAHSTEERRRLVNLAADWTGERLPAPGVESTPEYDAAVTRFHAWADRCRGGVRWDAGLRRPIPLTEEDP